MDSATLDELMHWNEELAALVAAGVPVDMGLARTRDGLSAELRRIDGVVARRMGQGGSLFEAVQDESVPAEYGCLVQLGLKGGDFSRILANNRRLGEAADESRHTLGAVLSYPLIVFLFAYVGLIGLCVYVVPTLESLYASLPRPPGPSLEVLRSLRVTMPYWAPLPPIVLGIFLVWNWRASRQFRASAGGIDEVRMGVTGQTRAIRLQRWAYFAEALATLLENQVPLDEGLRIAGGACGDDELRLASDAIAGSLGTHSHLADGSTAAKRFPPFLWWALWRSEETLGRVRALRMANELYLDAAARSSERWRTALPVVASVLLGGGVTLLYGLALFLPIVDLLKQLAS